MNTLIQNVHIEIGLKQEQKIFQDNQVFADPDTMANLNPNQVHYIKDTVLWTLIIRKWKYVMTMMKLLIITKMKIKWTVNYKQWVMSILIQLEKNKYRKYKLELEQPFPCKYICDC